MKIKGIHNNNDNYYYLTYIKYLHTQYRTILYKAQFQHNQVHELN